MNSFDQSLTCVASKDCFVTDEDTELDMSHQLHICDCISQDQAARDGHCQSKTCFLADNMPKLYAYYSSFLCGATCLSPNAYHQYLSLYHIVCCFKPSVEESSNSFLLQNGPPAVLPLPSSRRQIPENDCEARSTYVHMCKCYSHTASGMLAPPHTPHTYFLIQMPR